MVLLAADVKEDGVAWGKFRVVGRMVRVGAVRTEGNDRREGESFSALFLVNLPKLFGAFLFRDTRVEEITDASDSVVIDEGSCLHAADFLLILHSAERVDERRAVHECPISSPSHQVEEKGRVPYAIDPCPAICEKAGEKSDAVLAVLERMVSDAIALQQEKAVPYPVRIRIRRDDEHGQALTGMDFLFRQVPERCRI